MDICSSTFGKVKSILTVRKVLISNVENETERVTIGEGEQTDEIDSYVKARYMSAFAACWRIFRFHLSGKSPTVIGLPVHLPGANRKQFGGQAIPSAVSKLIRYLYMRPKGPPFDTMLYTEYFKLYRFSRDEDLQSPKERSYQNQPPHWVRERVQQRPVTRLQLKYPGKDDFYLRALLGVKSGYCFEDLRTVGETRYATFQEAAVAFGLFATNNEAELTMQEAFESYRTPRQLRSLFIRLIYDTEVPAIELFETWKDRMNIDNRLKFGEGEQADLQLLKDLQTLLAGYNKRLSDYGIEEPPEDGVRIERERSRWRNVTTRIQLRNAVDDAQQTMSDEQKLFTSMVLNRLRQRESMTIFLSGEGKQFKKHLCIRLIEFSRYRKDFCTQSYIE